MTSLASAMHQLILTYSYLHKHFWQGANYLHNYLDLLRALSGHKVYSYSESISSHACWHCTPHYMLSIKLAVMVSLGKQSLWPQDITMLVSNWNDWVPLEDSWGQATGFSWSTFRDTNHRKDQFLLFRKVKGLKCKIY